jgi:hypothetical protein
MPVGDIKRTIRSKLQVYWPEVFVVSFYKVLAVMTFISGTVVR